METRRQDIRGHAMIMVVSRVGPEGAYGFYVREHHPPATGSLMRRGSRLTWTMATLIISSAKCKQTVLRAVWDATEAAFEWRGLVRLDIQRTFVGSMGWRGGSLFRRGSFGSHCRGEGLGGERCCFKVVGDCVAIDCGGECAE